MGKVNKYRFFYHYYKQYNEMSVHFKKSCTRVKDVVCNVPCTTKWAKTQPYLRMEGFAEKVEIIDGKAYIS